MFTWFCVFLAVCSASVGQQSGPLVGNYAKKRCYNLDLTVFYRIPGGLTLSPSEVAKKMTGKFSLLTIFLSLTDQCKDVSVNIVDFTQTPPGQSDVIIRATIVFNADEKISDSDVDSRLSGCIVKTLKHKSVLDLNLPTIQVGDVHYAAYNKTTISNKRSCCDGVTPPPCCSAGSVNVSKSRCACISGHYALNKYCLRCPADSYQPNQGQTMCKGCPQGLKTFNKTGASTSFNCSDRNPIQIDSRGTEYIFKDVKAGSVVANVNVSADFDVAVKPLLYYINSVTSKPSYQGDARNGGTPSTQRCHSIGKKPPASFFCIQQHTGAIEITNDFKWRTGDEFELTVHVTDSDPHGRTGTSGKILLVSKDVCGDIQSLRSKVQENCPRDGLVRLLDVGPYPKPNLNISTSSVTSIIQANVLLSSLQSPETKTTYSMKLTSGNTEMEVSFRVDTIRAYDVRFVQPLTIQPSVSEITVELSANDKLFKFHQADAIILYGVPKTPRCPGANCLDPLLQWQAALSNLTSQVVSASCSRDAQHMRLRFVACFGE